MEYSVELANKLAYGLYEAIQDNARLPTFLGEIARAFHAHTAGFRISDPDNPGFTQHYLESVGISASQWRDFDKRSAHLNFWRSKGFDDMRTHGVGHDGMIAPRAELIKTPFYRDHLNKIDIDYGMGICLWMGQNNQAAVISLNRSRISGEFGTIELAFAKSLLPHFRSAYAIMRRLNVQEARIHSLSDTLDRMRVGALLVTGAARLVSMNDAAHQMLASGHGVHLSSVGILRCNDPCVRQKVMAAVQLAVLGKLTMPIRVPVRSAAGELSMVLIITMLRVTEGLRASEQEPVAAIFLHSADPTAATPINPETILRESFRLTPAEARLAQLLALGRDLSNCSAELGISISTARTHLRNLFAKTNTRRQSALISTLTLTLRAT